MFKVKLLILIVGFIMGVSIQHAVSNDRLKLINQHVTEYVKQEQGSQDKCFSGIEQIIIYHDKI